jgi:hypothetical protein
VRLKPHAPSGNANPGFLSTKKTRLDGGFLVGCSCSLVPVPCF